MKAKQEAIEKEKTEKALKKLEEEKERAENEKK